MINTFRFLCLVISLIISGCAVSYTDEQGQQHIFGFVNISLSGIEDEERKAGDRLEITNFGALFMKSQIHSGVGFGFNKEVSMIIKNDVLILNENVVVGEDSDQSQPK